MAKAVWTRFITDSSGAVVDGASVTVFLSDGITPATIFSDPAGSAKANPFLTPSGGKAEFYADPGIYVIQASKDGKTATWNDEEIGMARRDNDLSDLDSAATARTNLGLKSAAVADILGTVSQSGGVPTGAIIEEGSGVNGKYVKYADGTLICTRAVDLGAYTDNKSTANLGDYSFQHVFSEPPVASCCIGVSSTSAEYATSLDVNIGSTTTSSWRNVSRYLRTSQADSGVGVTLWLTAIGRWF